jgi:hypothetical protein
MAIVIVQLVPSHCYLLSSGAVTRVNKENCPPYRSKRTRQRLAVRARTPNHHCLPLGASADGSWVGSVTIGVAKGVGHSAPLA